MKTNRRDSSELAKPGRAGLLTAVQLPMPEDEAVRDLARAFRGIDTLTAMLILAGCMTFGGSRQRRR